MIYFLQESDSTNIKIGYTASSDPTGRQRTQQTGNSELLVIIAHMEGDAETDKQLRERFRYAKVAGEWYRPVPELLQLIIGRRSEAEWRSGFDEGRSAGHSEGHHEGVEEGWDDGFKTARKARCPICQSLEVKVLIPGWLAPGEALISCRACEEMSRVRPEFDEEDGRLHVGWYEVAPVPPAWWEEQKFIET